MKNLSCLAVATLGLAALAGSAQADTMTFLFTAYDGSTPVATATGTLTLAQIGVGTYLATSGSVTFSASPIDGTYSLVPGGPGVFGIAGFNVDNQVFYPPVGGPGGYLDLYGLGFSNGSDTVNIWGNGPSSLYSGYHYNGSYDFANDTSTFEVTSFVAVPVPAASLTGLAGLAGLGVFGRRRVRA